MNERINAESYRILSKRTRSVYKNVTKALVKAEIDEKTKTIVAEKKPWKKLTSGLGDDKTCIITAVQRKGRSYIHTKNMRKPDGEDVKCLFDHI